MLRSSAVINPQVSLPQEDHPVNERSFFLFARWRLLKLYFTAHRWRTVAQSVRIGVIRAKSSDVGRSQRLRWQPANSDSQSKPEGIKYRRKCNKNMYRLGLYIV